MQAPAPAAGCKSDLRILDPESGELKRDRELERRTRLACRGSLSPTWRMFAADGVCIYYSRYVGDDGPEDGSAHLYDHCLALNEETSCWYLCQDWDAPKASRGLPEDFPIASRGLPEGFPKASQWLPELYHVMMTFSSRRLPESFPRASRGLPEGFPMASRATSCHRSHQASHQASHSRHRRNG